MSWKKKEEQLFDLLKTNHIKDLEWSEGDYSHHDCFSLQYRCDIELKCRNTHYDELLIERVKYDALIARALKFNTHPLYINQTPQGVYVFVLSKLKQPTWEMRNMPKTSHFSDRNFTPKEVGYLSIKDAFLL